jgi:multiple sugar transport system substrate-binding protein
MSKEAAESYLGAIKESLNSPNMVLDLRVPQNQRYEQIVLDTAIARLLAGEINIDQAAEAIETGWSEITEELGRDAQRKAYQAALGVRR